MDGRNVMPPSIRDIRVTSTSVNQNDEASSHSQRGHLASVNTERDAISLNFFGGQRESSDLANRENEGFPTSVGANHSQENGISALTISAPESHVQVPRPVAIVEEQNFHGPQQPFEGRESMMPPEREYEAHELTQEFTGRNEVRNGDRGQPGLLLAGMLLGEASLPDQGRESASVTPGAASSENRPATENADEHARETRRKKKPGEIPKGTKKKPPDDIAKGTKKKAPDDIPKGAKNKPRTDSVKPKRKAKEKIKMAVETDGQEAHEETEENIQGPSVAGVTGPNRKRSGRQRNFSVGSEKISPREINEKARAVTQKQMSLHAIPIARPNPKNKETVMPPKTMMKPYNCKNDPRKKAKWFPKLATGSTSAKKTSTAKEGNGKPSSKTLTKRDQWRTNSRENEPKSESSSRASSASNSSRTRANDAVPPSKISSKGGNSKTRSKENETPVVRKEKRTSSKSQKNPLKPKDPPQNEMQEFSDHSGVGVYAPESQVFSVTQESTNVRKHSTGPEKLPSGEKKTLSKKGSTPGSGRPIAPVEPIPNGEARGSGSSSSSSVESSSSRKRKRSESKGKKMTSKEKKKIAKEKKMTAKIKKMPKKTMTRIKLENKGVMSKVYMKPRKRTFETQTEVTLHPKPNAATGAKNETDMKPRSSSSPKEKKSKMGEKAPVKYMMPAKKSLIVKSPKDRPRKIASNEKGKKHAYNYKELARRRRARAASRAKSTKRRKANTKSRRKRKGSPKKTPRRKGSGARRQTAKSRKY